MGNETPLELAVVYSGRFQPFHPGHYAVWRQLVARFGEAAVWIASSGRTGPADPGKKLEPAPLRFEEKRWFATRLFPIPAARFVQVRSPYRPVELLSTLDPARTAYVAVLGHKDADRLQSAYFSPLPPEGPVLPYPERGYVLVLAPQSDGLSSRQIRAELSAHARGEAEKMDVFKRIYGKADPEALRLLLDRLEASV